MRYISIQANDTLFFRDGRPFSMGDDTFAMGIFPPPPSVLYGALRTVYLGSKHDDGIDFDQWIPETEKLALKHVGLSDAVHAYFPLPLDLIVPDRNAINGAYAVEKLTLKDKPGYSNALTEKVLTSNYEGKSIDGPKVVTQMGFINYLNGGPLPSAQLLSDFYVNEPKIGIGRNKSSNIADEGRLFRINTYRLAKERGIGIAHLKFLIGFEGLDDFPEKGLLAIGGERRTASFDGVRNPVTINQPALTSHQFKIYLSTPSVFIDGWKPQALFDKHGLKLIAAATSGTMQIGGWALRPGNGAAKAGPQPKPMVQAVPPGAVYYVEAESTEAANNAAAAIHGQSISDTMNNIDYAKQGFGIAYIGKI